MANNYTRLGGSNTTFASMMQRFGVVTVMNADVYDAKDIFNDTVKTVEEVLTAAKTAKKLCRLDTLKVANVTVEGPSKTVTGGQYSNPLIKFGKSARLEMQDALGSVGAIDALCGGITESSAKASDTDKIDYSKVVALHIGEDFNGPKTIIGDSFFIDQKTGQQVKVKIIFYQFLPDSLFNLTQDSEGDATVFDMNGDLMTTDIKTYDIAGNPITHGIFYSIVDGAEAQA